MKETEISMIVAADSNNAIGSDNKMPWHLPDDFKYFKSTTLGHTVIMGRLTMESLPFPLPKRRNIVMSSNKDSILEGFEHAKSSRDALSMVEGEEKVFIIGGGQIYTQFSLMASEIHKTKVDTEIENADTWFPNIIEEEWELESTIFHDKDERHKYSFSFNVYKRKS